jgi:hypothetical protein
VRVSLGCKETVGAGITEQFRFETSADGVAWTTNIADSSFANIHSPHGLSMVGNPIRTLGNGPSNLLEIGNAPFRTIAHQ